jgi:hypothetical protein
MPKHHMSKFVLITKTADPITASLTRTLNVLR